MRHAGTNSVRSMTPEPAGYSHRDTKRPKTHGAISSKHSRVCPPGVLTLVLWCGTAMIPTVVEGKDHCLETALASVLEVEPDEVPDFSEWEVSWKQGVVNWLRERG